MNHIKIVLQIIVLFFGFSAFAESVCTLLEKDVEQRKYSFKCNNEIVNIQCAIKNATVCKVNIKEKLKSSSFEITDDQFNSLNLFSMEKFEKIKCESKNRLCEIEKNACDKYEGVFERAKNKFLSEMKSKPCNAGIGAAVVSMGAFSGNFVSDVEFSKKVCEQGSGESLVTLKDKISIFENNLNLPFQDPSALMYGCVQQKNTERNLKEREELIKTKREALSKLKTSILEKMSSSSQIRDLACLPGNEAYYPNGKLNINLVMCAIVEDSVIALGDPAITCDEFGVNHYDSFFGKMKSSNNSGAAYAERDRVAAEQKAMPQAMSSEIGKPIGLTPALAQVDQAVPGSGTAQGSTPSESNIASGAVRNTIPTAAAIQAGQAFAPVYERLSGMANVVSSSGRTSVIGRNAPKSNNGASGIVTVNRKLPASSDSSIDPSSLVGAAAASGATAGFTNNSDADPNKATKAAGLKRSAADDTEVAPISGPRPISLGGGSSGGSRGVAATVAAGAANSEAVSSAALANVQQKIIQLNTPAKVISFFKEEALSIPGLRSVLYSDATSGLLAKKGIRVVNQSGGFSGEELTKAKYVFSDDGTKFTKLTIGKKN